MWLKRGVLVLCVGLFLVFGVGWGWIGGGIGKGVVIIEDGGILWLMREGCWCVVCKWGVDYCGVLD